MDERPWTGRRVLVTGATGFIGRSLVRHLAASGATLLTPGHSAYDLLEQGDVRRLFADTRPDVVFHLAGLVGGILANREQPADYCQQNLLMGTLVIDAAWRAGVAKYVTLIGGCSYPARADNPIVETALWDGYPQAESAPYSLAKRMAVVLAEAYRRQHGFDAIVLVPGNVYGPHDNFDLQASHVIPALIRKFIDARDAGREDVAAWGSGRPVRDFVYVDDATEAIVRGAERYSGSDIINISSGVPTTIRELVELVARLTRYRGRVTWDTSKPDGQMLKAFDVTRMRDWLGYVPTTSLEDGVARTIAWFETHRDEARLAVAVERRDE